MSEVPQYSELHDGGRADINRAGIDPRRYQETVSGTRQQDPGNPPKGLLGPHLNICKPFAGGI